MVWTILALLSWCAFLFSFYKNFVANNRIALEQHRQKVQKVQQRYCNHVKNKHEDQTFTNENSSRAPRSELLTCYKDIILDLYKDDWEFYFNNWLKIKVLCDKNKKNIWYLSLKFYLNDVEIKLKGYLKLTSSSHKLSFDHRNNEQALKNLRFLNECTRRYTNFKTDLFEDSTHVIQHYSYEGAKVLFHSVAREYQFTFVIHIYKLPNHPNIDAVPVIHFIS